MTTFQTTFLTLTAGKVQKAPKCSRFLWADIVGSKVRVHCLHIPDSERQSCNFVLVKPGGALPESDPPFGWLDKPLVGSTGETWLLTSDCFID